MSTTGEARRGEDLEGQAAGSASRRLIVRVCEAKLDAFSHLGIFSRRTMSPEEFARFDGVFADAEYFNRKVKLFWWGAGTAEEGISYSPKRNLAELSEKGIKSVFVEFPGTSHEWQPGEDAPMASRPGSSRTSYGK